MLYYLLGIVCVVYYVYIAIYRILLSPISRFPGPKLAALTWWYEFYYDVIKVRKSSEFLSTIDTNKFDSRVDNTTEKLSACILCMVRTFALHRTSIFRPAY